MKNQGDKEKHEFRCKNCLKIIPSEVIADDRKGMVECSSCGGWNGYDFTEGVENKYGGPGQPLFKQVHSIVDLSTRDSQGRKRRAYILINKDNVMFYCHNCNRAW